MPPVLGKLKTCNSLPVEEEEALEINPHEGTTINQLPFDCFHLIFRGFDLRTQILHLRTVCHLWHAHIAAICAQTSHITLNARFRSLTSKYKRDLPNGWFFLGNLQQYIANREAYCNDLEYRLPRITKLTANSSLFSLFAPTLTELNLNFDRNYPHKSINVGNVAKLLKSFTAFANLRTLSLFFCSVLIDDFFKNDHQTIQSLYRTIGDCITRAKFPRLTNFDLSMDCYLIAKRPAFIKLNHEIDLDPHLLSQLEHFSMNFHTKRVPVLMGQLNPNLTCLSFNCHQLPSQYAEPKVEQLDAALLGEPQFGPSLTHLRLDGAWPAPLKLFCDRFAALQLFQLRVHDVIFDQNWIKPLNQLKHLEELRLIGFRIHVLQKNLPLEYSCLPRVKKLTHYNPALLNDFAKCFCAGKRFDGDLFCRTVAAQFPNLEELVLITREPNKRAPQVRDHLYHFKNLKTKFLNFDF